MEKARADGRLVGDRHRSRPHDHRARGGHRGVAADRGRVMSSHPAPPAGIDPLDLVDPGALRRARLSARRVDAPAGRGAGRVLRAARATSRSGRSPSTPTSSTIAVAAAALLERARAHRSGRDRRARAADRRWSSCSIRRATGRCAGSRCGRFTPRAVRARQRRDRPHRGRGARRARRWPTAPSEFDFVERIAAPFPLAVIAWILGVPDADWELLFRWTNEVIGKDDPEYRRPGETPGPDDQARARRAARVPRRADRAAPARTAATTW